MQERQGKWNRQCNLWAENKLEGCWVEQEEDGTVAVAGRALCCWTEEHCAAEQDYVFKQQKEACKAWEQVFQEWERLKLNIRELGQALESLNNPLLKHNMEADLVVLINKKNQ